ncbi:MAG: hypothetical protein PVJ63_04140, partial [Thioalkalispiraceae bacterium]
MNYIVNTYNLTDQISVVNDLVKNNLTVNSNHYDVLNWKNHNNSHCSLIKQDDKHAQYVGCVCMYERDFYVNNVEKRGCVFGDLVMNKEHRTVLPAMKMLKHHTEYALNGCDFIYTLPNSKSNALFKRLDYIKIGTMPRYARVANYHLHITSKTLHLKAARSILQLVDFARKKYHAINKHYLSKIYSIVNDSDLNKVKQYYGNYDKLHTFSLKKDFDYIAWRYFLKPKEYYSYLFIGDVNDSAFIIYEQNNCVVYIKDVLFTSFIVLKDVISLMVSISILNNMRTV